MTTDRKMEIAWKTTPEELRVIAGYLEQDGCNQVRVSWYHTQLCFVLDRDEPPKPPPIVELDGLQDGSIPVNDDISEAKP
jgi:hypothetical protein